MSKKQKAQFFIEQMRGDVFDAKDVCAIAKCSKSTAYRALREHGLYWYWRPDGHGNFTKTFFPLSWTATDCLQWMNAQTKNFKSKARLNSNRIRQYVR